MTDPDLRVASSAPRTVRRLFFALWPDDALLDLLVAVVHRYAGAVHGRPQRRDQLHVTLEFLGGVEDGRVGEVIAAGRFAAGCSGPSDIVFDRLEYWKRPQVLCMTAGVLPEPLSALVDGLRDALQSRGFEPEQRPFKAHLTLARKVRRAPSNLAVEPLRWEARSFALVESVTGPGGSRYERLESWPLGAGPGT